MLSLISGTVNYILQKPERRFLFIGLDNAGKTTSLEQVKGNFGKKHMDLSKIIPTIGMNVAKVEIDKVDCLIWDLGGHRNFRVIWKNYFAETQGLVFIVDASDPERLGEAREVLHQVLNDDAFSHASRLPLLVMCNKSDLRSGGGFDDNANVPSPKTVGNRRGFEAAQSTVIQSTTKFDISRSIDSVDSGGNMSDSLGSKINVVLSADNISERLGIEEIRKGRSGQVNVVSVSALRNEGIKEGMQWLVSEARLLPDEKG